MFRIQANRYLRGINLDFNCEVALALYRNAATHGTILLFDRFAEKKKKKRAVFQ
jgi:hypothetical protein